MRTVVSWDLDYSDGELAEAELAFYAQDDDGNVWRMGEYPEEYDGGQIVDAPTWIFTALPARGRREMSHASRALSLVLRAMPKDGDPPWTGRIAGR